MENKIFVVRKENILQFDRPVLFSLHSLHCICMVGWLYVVFWSEILAAKFACKD